MGVGKMLNKTRILSLIITLILLLIAIKLHIDRLNFHNKASIFLDKNNKISHNIVYINIPRFLNERGFIDIFSNDTICNDYIKKRIIFVSYEYNNIFEIKKSNTIFYYDEFKYKNPIKIILTTKYDIKRCKYNVVVYPGKINMFIYLIIFYLLPVSLILVNIVSPILKYLLFGKLKKLK